MLKDEFKFIGKNRLILLSVLVIMLIPFLYSIFFLKSVWDPYGDTKDLPVAVVNQDKAVDYQGKTIAVGDEMVKTLKKDDQLGWRFVSAAQAKKGMKDNKYYTVITIPSNFSAHAATVLDTKPQKMNLTYETNDSLNYLSQVISGVGVDKLNSEIRAKVTNVYASALFSQMKLVGTGMSKAATGATQIGDGLVTLDNGLNQYTVGVSQVNNGLQTMKVQVNPLSSGVQQLASGASQLDNGLGQLNGKVAPLASGVSQLATGSEKLASGVNQYTNGTGSAAAGATQLNKGVQELSNQLATSNSADKQAQVQAILKALPQINSGLQQLNQSVSGITVSAPDLSGTMASVKADGAQLQTGLGTVQTGLQTAQADVTKAVPTAVAAMMAKGMSQADATAIATQLAGSSTTGLTQAATGLKTAATAGTSLNTTLTSLQNDPSLSALATLPAQIEELQKAVKQLATGSSVALPGAVTAIQELSGGLNKIQSAVNVGVDGQPSLVGGTQQLASGLQTLTGKSSELNAGANQINGGLGQLNGQIPALTSGVGQLATGASQLDNGLGQLNSQIPTLKSGVTQLADGASQLNGNSGQLTDGAGKLKTGNKTLATQLNDGAKQINGIKTTSATTDMFAAPTKVTHKNYSYVPNYGHALAPYVLSLALYVGALVFNFAYPIRKVSKVGGTATQWFASKAVLGGLVAVGAALVEATLMMIGGLTVANVGQYYLFAVLFSLASMYLVMFLSMSLDNPGRFIAMVLLMLQLGGSGGTFPMEITNGFYNAIHPFLPMTYSILGFRNALTGGIASGTVGNAVAFLIMVSVISLVLLWLSMIFLQRRHLMGVSQLDNNQELQAVEK